MFMVDASTKRVNRKWNSEILLKHGQRCLNSVNYFFFVSHNVRNYFLSAIGVKISGDIAGPDWRLTLVVF